MTGEILLALTASMFTATSAVAQRVAAAPAPGEFSFSWRLVVYLVRRPVWFFGILCMIAGFAFQLLALRVGDLSLVQPVIATELLFVFGWLALRDRQRRVRARDWMAAVGMAGGLGVFLFLADPSGGSPSQATAWHWILAAAATFGAAGLVAALAMLPSGPRRRRTAARRAALLSISAGIAWGFVAAVVKELSSHLSQGLVAVFSNWSPYVLLLSGAAAMFLVSNAFQAGSLAATQPGLTLVDPLVASLLGITVFGEHLSANPWHLFGEGVAGVALVGSVILLARSPLIQTTVLALPFTAPSTTCSSTPCHRKSEPSLTGSTTAAS